MCAQFIQKWEAGHWAQKLIRDAVDLHCRPMGQALILRAQPNPQDSDPAMEPQLMRFSLLPAWAKEERLRYSTHNARLETVTEKASFKRAFHSQRCLVPMTAFWEAVYDGPLAGHWISFSRPANIVFAAGIWEHWTGPRKSSEVLSFSILTRPATPFIESMGHDRSPIFLPRDAAKQWIQSPMSSNQAQEWLGSIPQPEEWDVRSEIKLKSLKKKPPPGEGQS